MPPALAAAPPCDLTEEARPASAGCCRRGLFQAAASAAFLGLPRMGGAQGTGQQDIGRQELGPGQQPAPLRCGGTGMALATLQYLASVWRQTEPGAPPVFVLPSLGTRGGLNAILAGVVDIALSARPLTAAEQAQGLTAIRYASTPVVFATRAGGTTEEVSLREVMQILAGTRTIWPDGTPLRLVRRDPSEASWLQLAALSPEMARAVEAARHRPGLLTAVSDQDNADALEHLPGSFGLIALGQLRAEGRHLRPLRLDDVAPSPAAATAGHYPLVQPLLAVTTLSPRPEVRAFLSFLTEAVEARALLAELGHAAAPRLSAACT